MNSKKPVPDNELQKNLCKLADKVGVKINDRATELCHCVGSKGCTEVNPIQMGQLAVAQGWGGG